ncbi:MAG: CapA family protein [Candidatus Limiplasma sp.]|nr:CapA family protein [Candidatus Limiplasma sp.]MEA5146334.1 CapA family protein [Candidatus Limiplasma sp.]
MKRVLAVLLALAFWPAMATAQAQVFTFAFDAPPAALTETVMTVVEGTTEVRLTFGGDCTLGGTAAGGARRFESYIRQHGFAYPFANLAALLQADDLSLVNLEGVLSARRLARVKKTFNFKGLPAYAAILQEGGVECVTLANNHALDYGAAGFRDTVQALEAAGIAYVDDHYVTVLQKDGVRVGFTASGLRINRKRFAAQAAALRELGCTVLVHVMHTGDEYAAYLTRAQRDTARYLADQGVQLVVGHHPHVVQGLEKLGSTMVAYSLGNLVFGGNTDPADQDAMLLGATFRFLDGVPTGSQVTLWPLTISGSPRMNDYQPALVSGDAAQRVMEKVQATSGFSLAPYRDGIGAVQAVSDLR